MMDTAELRRKAEAATPGPWASYNGFTEGDASITANLPCINGLDAHFTIARVDAPDIAETQMTDGALTDERAKANAAFIAAANPKAVLALLDRITELEDAFERHSENMAFILNHQSLPEQWYEKFTKELAEDRDALHPHQENEG
jgi:hypothetical protein